MPKLVLKANPTFIVPVSIPVAGGAAQVVNFEFKHRRKTALAEFIASRAGVNDIDTVMDCATGWDLDEPFNRDNVDELLEINAGAAVAIYRKYVDELQGARTGN